MKVEGFSVYGRGSSKASAVEENARTRRATSSIAHPIAYHKCHWRDTVSVFSRRPYGEYAMGCGPTEILLVVWEVLAIARVPIWWVYRQMPWFAPRQPN